MKKNINDEEMSKKRKKRLTIEILISLAIAAIGITLLVISIVKEIVGLTIAGIVVILFGIAFFKIIDGRSQKYCLNCGKSMKGCEYSYQEIRREAASGNNGGINVYVSIRAVCPYCGATKSFSKKFMVSPGHNIQYQVDSFCRRKFGH